MGKLIKRVEFQNGNSIVYNPISKKDKLKSVNFDIPYKELQKKDFDSYKEIIKKLGER